MSAWHYFSLEACSDGSKSLVAGTCTNLDSDNNPIWSNYVSLNKVRILKNFKLFNKFLTSNKSVFFLVFFNNCPYLLK